jgi:hypothetical protein
VIGASCSEEETGEECGMVWARVGGKLVVVRDKKNDT